MTTFVGLSPARSSDTVRSFAENGAVGARLYDRLIGQVAIQYAILRIVSWNVRHMRDLFPDLDVCDPVDALAR